MSLDIRWFVCSFTPLFDNLKVLILMTPGYAGKKKWYLYKHLGEITGVLWAVTLIFFSSQWGDWKQLINFPYSCPHYWSDWCLSISLRRGVLCKDLGWYSIF